MCTAEVGDPNVTLALDGHPRCGQRWHLAERLLVEHLGEVSAGEGDALQHVPELRGIRHARKADVTQRLLHRHLGEVPGTERYAEHDVPELLSSGATHETRLVQRLLDG